MNIIFRSLVGILRALTQGIGVAVKAPVVKININLKTTEKLYIDIK